MLREETPLQRGLANARTTDSPRCRCDRRASGGEASSYDLLRQSRALRFSLSNKSHKSCRTFSVCGTAHALAGLQRSRRPCRSNVAGPTCFPRIVTARRTRRHTGMADSMDWPTLLGDTGECAPARASVSSCAVSIAAERGRRRSIGACAAAAGPRDLGRTVS